VNKWTDIATIALGFVAFIGFIGAMFTWFYKRGGHERAFADALDRNTKANNDVAAKLEEFKSVVLDMFHDLDKRVAMLEGRK
jgi:hypothetical protein